MDVEDIKNNAASDIHVKRFQAKKVEVRTVQGPYMRRRLRPAGKTSSSFCARLLIECCGKPDARMRAETICECVTRSRKLGEVLEASFVFKHHIIPERKLYAPKKKTPVSLRYVVVRRQTKTNLDVLQEKNDRRVPISLV